MKIIFDNKGTFKAKEAAGKWLDNNGYSYGASCVCAPQAIKKGDWYIAKWRNLSLFERVNIDGTITGDGREGPITIEIFDKENSYE